VVIVAVQWLLWLVLPALVSASIMGYAAAFGGLLGGLAVVAWWAFFSRAPRLERWGAPLLMLGGLLAFQPLLHRSIAGGAMGLMYYVYAIPAVSLFFVVWAVAGRRLPAAPRRAAMAAAILLPLGGWTLLRTDGASTTGFHFAWRWSQTAEERLLARADEEPPAAAIEAATAAPGTARVAWPGFRGPGRDAVVRGLRIATDWTRSPPRELWRRPIGPGWSSFAVGDGLLYTQEQRGDDELVSCYRTATGEPVWRHRDPVRFWEANAGPGPRGTPALHDGRLYAFGATGILNALDAVSGAVLWRRDVAADAGEEIPTWGFSSSPLVAGELVVVAAGGRLAAYDRAGGELRWLGPARGGGYSSPHRLTLDGVDQIVLLSAAGATAVAPADGSVLWQHDRDGNSIVQPAQTAGGDLLLGADLTGTQRIAVSFRNGGWSVAERWTSRRFQPDFNDYVVHRGHAYGFDGRILACLDLETGERRWKGGRYGKGQLLLLADQDLLLVSSERGELALVGADPEGFVELARFPALEGKTWNHPALAGDLLLVRNGEEMAAFRLSVEGAAAAAP